MKRPLNRRSVEKLSERERTVGLDPGDAAAEWLDENAPREELKSSRSAHKSKTLHRWRQEQLRKKG
ncbi:MAG: hypothetical protein QOF43_1905 [Gaiellaceae bacterium]|nr:hypothetical protein [Gaiellaceae bacterium]